MNVTITQGGVDFEGPSAVGYQMHEIDAITLV
jgi:hypothetical protein